MRLWSIHPQYLDPQGLVALWREALVALWREALVALWREALLAQAVLRGATKGYRHHPQLIRFQSHPEPLSAISTYLASVHSEASSRGYVFDSTKVPSLRTQVSIIVTQGQMDYEWQHLLAKLQKRNPEIYVRLASLGQQSCHPLFKLRAGSIEPWEIVKRDTLGSTELAANLFRTTQAEEKLKREKIKG